MLDVILILAAIILLAALFSVIRTRKIVQKNHKTSELLKEISKKDESWSEENLKNTAESTYYRIMNSLAKQNIEEIKELVHPSLFSKWSKLVEQFANSNPDNLTNNKIEEIKIVDIDNYIDNEKDTFTAELAIMESEYIVDGHGKLISDNYNPEQEESAVGLLIEYWKFERENDNWVVIGVSRSNHWKEFVKDPLINEEAAQE